MKEAVGIKKFIIKLGIVPSIVKPILLYCDNNRAFVQVKESSFHHRSKHVFKQYNLFREIIQISDIKIECVPKDDILVDLFIEALSQ